MGFLCSLGFHNVELKKTILQEHRVFFRVVRQFKCSRCGMYSETSEIFEAWPIMDFDEVIEVG
jgi:hypothetical protein